MNDTGGGNSSRSPLAGRETVATEHCAKRVRAYFAGQLVVDSQNVQILFEQGRTPVYYFPWQDICSDCLEPGTRTSHCPRKGDACYWSIRIGERFAPDAVWSYPQPLPHCPPIGNLAAFYWDAMDAWFEEDEEVFVHPRDPYTRIDVLASSRHVHIELGGIPVADCRRPMLLFETGLPVRYYLPKPDIDWRHLRTSVTTTACPYKGQTSRYWSASAGVNNGTILPGATTTPVSRWPPSPATWLSIRSTSSFSWTANG
jgi:uncharacterized protein (DUF427 family)